MGAGIENLFEPRRLLAAHRTAGHLSIETNRTCRFEKTACGNTCFLVARRAPDRRPLTLPDLVRIADEVYECGPRVLHASFAGMEPFERAPGEKVPAIFPLLERYHARPVDRRPLSVNAISSGVMLRQYADRLRATPLDSLVVSVDDAPSTGLRTLSAAAEGFAAALHVRDTGGVDKLCVNTTLTADNADAVLAIGRRVIDAGIDQWMISPLRVSDGRTMRAAVSDDAMLALAARLDRELPHGGRTRIVLDVRHDTLARAAAGSARRVSEWAGWAWRWVMDHVAVELQAFCPEARFLRVRYDGELMNKAELHHVGLERSALGPYRPGVIRAAVDRWTEADRAAGIARPVTIGRGAPPPAAAVRSAS